MAENVQYFLEKSLDELNLLKAYGLFNSVEIRCIIKQRREYEYKVHKRSKSKDDYLKYINFETNLLALIRKRRKKLNFYKDLDNIDRKIIKRIACLYRAIIYKHQSDVKLWLSYLSFLKEVKWKSAVSRAYVRMLQVHSTKNWLWIEAAKWEWQMNNSDKNARSYFLQALKHIPNSEILYLEYLRFELLYIEYLRQRLEFLSIESLKENNYADKILEGSIVKTILEDITVNIKKPEFFISCLSLCSEFSFALHLQENIICLLWKNFYNSEITWDTSALCILEKKNLSWETVTDSIPKNSKFENITNILSMISKSDFNTNYVSHCLNVYEEAVLHFGTPLIWEYYLDTCIQLCKSATFTYKSRYNHLLNILKRMCKNNYMSVELFIKVNDIVKEDNKQEILDLALQQFPQSADLWKCFMLTEEKISNSLLLEAVLKIGDNQNAQVFWEQIIEKNNNNNYNLVSELLQNEQNKSKILSTFLRSLHLKWELKIKGISNCRKLYTYYCTYYPTNLDFYQTMIEIEISQKQIDIDNIRNIFEQACNKFGAFNPDLWISYIQFESKFGKPFNCSSLYNRALHHLNADHWENFYTKFVQHNI